MTAQRMTRTEALRAEIRSYPKPDAVPPSAARALADRHGSTMAYAAMVIRGEGIRLLSRADPAPWEAQE